MEPYWLTVIIVVTAALIGFLVVELFRLARKVNSLTALTSLLMAKDKVLMTELTKLFVEKGIADGIKTPDGNCFFLPVEMSHEAKQLALKIGELMPKNGGSGAD